MKFLRYCLVALILIGSSLVQGTEGAGQCYLGFKNKTVVCSNYITNSDYIYFDGSNTDHSLSLLKVAQGLSTLKLNEQTQRCVDAFSSYACAITYPKCVKGQEELQPICTSTCTNAISSCTYLTDPIVLNYIISSPLFPTNASCSAGYISTTTTNLTIKSDQCNLESKLSSSATCFPPLVEDFVNSFDKSKSISTTYCSNGCCLPCPQSYFLYPEGYLEKGFLATQIVRAISAITSFIMVISYLVLPGKRSHPSSLILFASIAIFLYSSSVFFSLGNPNAIQCTNDVEPSTQDNNALCSFQGIIIVNLHIHTVWNSNIIGNNYLYLHLIGWGVPIILTIIALAARSIMYQFATLCLVQQSKANFIFFYPLASIVVPSFLIHIATFFYIVKISREEEKKKSDETSSTEEFRSSHKRHVIQLGNISNGPTRTDFLSEWLLCIQQGKGQNACSGIASNYMPPFWLIIGAEMSTSFIGIHLFCIFSNATLWREWKQWLNEKIPSRKQIEVPEQFFAI
ncbi:28667_t:CDS:2 [Dentiscutata erythropus]|uniref:28667_t:CDS:1 n=1 Tax=Dentiscutata erythropus TaxID=1348616 RepID=A0A9N9DZD7_9GLOM|nr:28667_t:CDS:2 [Dentiscutata erythropus]